ncbi:FAA hydrolase family protein [Corticibacter populi]|uniref:FAA hydrolase family protein n=1 Tax=Corticibacter populi TaxID=1550736 RepID=A0A3M6QXW4_9BURK|nr:fumarylacetoacetate hydrolase family protein [Corticibacter populi]RMX07857.1 FAA hydrolase family protein [Corticibacter populi]RZS35092.1 fumarylpyruvate hydrolase [Corticibacter populi]
MSLLFQPQPTPTVAISGQDALFPVHRIYCVGQNYAKHAQEMGASGREAPFFFMKPADAIVFVPAGSTGTVAYPSLTQSLHHEVELVVAIGKGGKGIAPEQALAHIYGYAVGLDLTRRDLQAELKKAGRPWSIAKGFDQSAPIGPITPRGQLPQIEHAGITLSIDGQLRQSGNTDELIWKLAEVVAHISNGWELQPGDLIFTGTPAGVGAVNRGEELQGHIDGLPDLHVKVV